MSPAKKKEAAKATLPKKLSTAEVFALAEQYLDAQKAELSAKKIKASAQNGIIQEIFERRKLRGVTQKKTGRRITVVQNETTVYDDEGLYGDLTPAQRRLAYERNVDLNALSADARKRVLAVLSKDELDSVTSYSLNLDKLSQAVQAGKIRAKVVAKFASIVKSAPYVRVTDGGK